MIPFSESAGAVASLQRVVCRFCGDYVGARVCGPAGVDTVAQSCCAACAVGGFDFVLGERLEGVGPLTGGACADAGSPALPLPGSNALGSIEAASAAGQERQRVKGTMTPVAQAPAVLDHPSHGPAASFTFAPPHWTSFWLVSGADFARSIAWAKRHGNPIADQIRAAEPWPVGPQFLKQQKSPTRTTMHQQTTPRFTDRLLRFWQAVKSLDFSHHRYALWKRWHRLDLSGESCESLGLDEARSHYHAESGGPELEVVLRALDLPCYYAAVDLGSGKGGAVFTLAKYFRLVTGVELSRQLVKIADLNADRLFLPHAVFVCCDATQFTPTANERVIYLFNPFPKVIVAEVMRNLMAQVRRQHLGGVWVIYKNPVGHDEVLAAGLTFIRVFTFPHGHPCHVYRC
jgi:hypothetical protein